MSKRDVTNHGVSPQRSNNHGTSGHRVPQVAASGPAMRTFVREPDRSSQDVVPCDRLQRDAYKQKIEAEVELAQAKLAELKAQAKGSVADARIKYAKQVAKLERGIDATKAKLQELSDANEDAWEHIKDEVESVWGALRATFQNIVVKIKG